MSKLTELTAKVAAPPNLTARNPRGVEFTASEVWWDAYPWGIAVTLMDRESGANTSLYPPTNDVSHLPHPGLWFDELAAEIATAAVPA